MLHCRSFVDCQYNASRVIDKLVAFKLYATIVIGLEVVSMEWRVFQEILNLTESKIAGFDPLLAMVEN